MDWRSVGLEIIGSSKTCIENKAKSVLQNSTIKNTDRTAGTILSNEITKNIKAAGLPDDTIHFKFNGTAGQSFGAFNTKGVTLELEGDANDYFGKGLSGARLIIYPSTRSNLCSGRKYHHRQRCFLWSHFW